MNEKVLEERCWDGWWEGRRGRDEWMEEVVERWMMFLREGWEN